jgi:hypothetical protein
MSIIRSFVAALVLFSAALVIPAPVRAADFRVANAVYVSGQAEPQSQGVTIFQDGLVYDFLNDPGEVIVFDKARQRFVLLDTGRHLQSEITTDEVQEVVDREKQRLAGSLNPNLKWISDPTFDESFSAEMSKLVLKSRALTYQVQIQAAEPEVAAQYREFSDWYAKFNLALDPKSRPPFPRLVLNDAIEHHKGVAKEVHLTADLGPKGQARITSRHQLTMGLDDAEHHRIAEARKYMSSFRSVSFQEYQQGK